jgi:hypothetical protein
MSAFSLANVTAIRFHSGFYDTIMSKAGYKGAYALALFWTDALVTFLVLAYGQLVQKHVFILEIDSIWVVLVLFSLYNSLFLLYLAYNFLYARQWRYDSVIIMFLIACLLAFACQLIEAKTAF